MVLGINTYSDAIKLSEEYARAVEHDKLVRKLAVFRLIDGVFDERTPQSVDAKEVFQNHQRRLTDASEFILEYTAQLELNHAVTVTVMHQSASEKYQHLPNSVTVASTSEPTKFAYSFTLANLLYDMVVITIQRVSEAYNRNGKLAPSNRIAVMRNVMRAINNSPMRQLASAAIGKVSDRIRAYEIETNPKHQVGMLVQFNEEVAARSDISLRFDESYFDFSGDNFSKSIQAKFILDEAHHATLAGVAWRQKLRDEIERIASEKGSVIINGTTYTPRTISDDECYVADSASKAMANLLGKPIVPPNTPLVRPDYWINIEIGRVAAYRSNPSAFTALEHLLKYYESS